MSSTENKTKGKASGIDVHVGKRLRQRRTLLGMTQEKLAEALGVTFQQVQKYERGANRVSAGKLYEVSKVLQTNIAYFFEGMSENDDAKKIIAGLSDNDQEGYTPDNIMQRKETLDLLRIYYSVQDEQKRKELFKIIKSMAENLKE